jgi:hypothetical protein
MGRLHAPHARRGCSAEICEPSGGALATASAQARLARRVSSRVARDWDGSFRVELQATPCVEAAAVRVRSCSHGPALGRTGPRWPALASMEAIT